MSIRLVIMGPQGSGKGTQAARISEHFGIPAISTGDIFRDNIARGTDLGKRAQEYTCCGELVPDEVTNQMVRARLGLADAADGFILDGYPRNAAQVAELDTILSDLGTRLDAVVQLTADRNELLARMRRRAEIEGRDDDTADVIARRLDIYEAETAPLAEAYAARALLVPVDGTGEIDEVTERVLGALGSRV
ncbi:adenylate kinase [Actinotalea fermentans]|uniref:Adenylate kinase n=1 Tax=Actinotalea fermentans TaxID=43671 RepID=A0A511Z048_9CELL|nr:adenylate kinase [Actinotalea fermentans]KGM17589.1 adenylate kinase [Actinotalea fermentans ATCC 43279 = JCM 9966 = DSM 3133]GEN80830.1 adenylate kinase [Actinotalea fermentans]